MLKRPEIQPCYMEFTTKQLYTLYNWCHFSDTDIRTIAQVIELRLSEKPRALVKETAGFQMSIFSNHILFYNRSSQD